MAKWKEFQEKIRDFESQFQNTRVIKQVEINGVKQHYDLIISPDVNTKEEIIKKLSSTYSFLGESQIVYYDGKQYTLDNKQYFFIRK